MEKMSFKKTDISRIMRALNEMYERGHLKKDDYERLIIKFNRGLKVEDANK